MSRLWYRNRNSNASPKPDNIVNNRNLNFNADINRQLEEFQKSNELIQQTINNLFNVYQQYKQEQTSRAVSQVKQSDYSLQESSELITTVKQSESLSEVFNESVTVSEPLLVNNSVKSNYDVFEMLRNMFGRLVGDDDTVESTTPAKSCKVESPRGQEAVVNSSDIASNPVLSCVTLETLNLPDS